MKKLLPLLVVLVFLLSGCLNENELKDTYESHEQPILEGEEIFTWGLYNEGSFEEERTFNISDDSFNRNVVVANKTTKDTSFTLLVFNHGEQMDFITSDVVTNNYQFDIESGQIADIAVNLQDIKDGYNSVTYIILKDPNELPQDYESSLNLTEMFSIRVNLFKNIDYIPEDRPNLFTEAEINDNRRIDGVFLGEKEEKYNVLYKESAKENSVEYNLVYGNSSSEAFDFYLVALLNNEQISLGKHPFIYDELKPNEEKVLPLDFNRTLDKANNTYQILMIPTPFEKVTKEEPFLMFSPTVSNRVTITNE